MKEFLQWMYSKTEFWSRVGENKMFDDKWMDGCACGMKQCGTEIRDKLKELN